jgi:DNA primase
MPGVRFRDVRAMIPLADVLSLLGFVAVEASQDQIRGPCPVHRSTSPRSRSFSANLKRHVYQCFRCGSAGNQLNLYVAATGLSLHAAAVDLCERLDVDIPWMQHHD